MARSSMLCVIISCAFLSSCNENSTVAPFDRDSWIKMDGEDRRPMARDLLDSFTYGQEEVNLRGATEEFVIKVLGYPDDKKRLGPGQIALIYNAGPAEATTLGYGNTATILLITFESDLVQEVRLIETGGP